MVTQREQKLLFVEIVLKVLGILLSGIEEK